MQASASIGLRGWLGPDFAGWRKRELQGGGNAFSGRERVRGGGVAERRGKETRRDEREGEERRGEEGYV